MMAIRMRINGRLIDGRDEVDCIQNWLAAIGCPREPERYWRRVAGFIVESRYSTLREAKRMVTQK